MSKDMIVFRITPLPGRRAFPGIFSVISAAALTLAACVPATPGGPGPGPSDSALPDPANDSCSARAAGHLIGKDSAALATIAARRDPVRVISPGQPVTMDYIAARLNVELDNAGRITRLFCG